ncbi:MAG: DUF2309 domain-containing protein [Planctomycetes bacterium]|nr:DUF2309 domain-containing protein [Planctomycetota bacterium]HPF14486.1 DUF2309 domain-containing protein [Planctomycetota bacterium]
MPHSLDPIIEQVCQAIAPSWPLDRFLAVNPFWERVEESLPAVSKQLAARSGARLLMPRAWYREVWQLGEFRREHLQAAIAQAGAHCTPDDLIALMDAAEPNVACRVRVMDLLDARRDRVHEMTWRAFVTHSLSQFCAAYFDGGQAQIGPVRQGGLYQSWRRQALHDRTPAYLMGFTGYQALVERLPESAAQTIETCLGDLGIPPAEFEAYLSGLLLDLGGWAAWCAYERWTARLQGGDAPHLQELLAIRVAWEWMLWQLGGEGVAEAWQSAIADWPKVDLAASQSQDQDWLLQRALELAYQDDLCQKLSGGLVRNSNARAGIPSVQAYFCIDVRSEVFRRALESQTDRVATSGFAGFFGMPIEYLPMGSASARPQLPGLLAPRMRVADDGTKVAAQRRATRFDVGSAWRQFKAQAISSFPAIESLGIFAGPKLVSETLGRSRSASPADQAGLTKLENAHRKPRRLESMDGAPLPLEQRIQLALSMLRGMGRTRDFARLVALVGHASATRNNPYRAGLDCGACCGQSGEVNARAAAFLLNDSEVRLGLQSHGIRIPDSTWFVAGLHNTTTDEVTLLDLDGLPASHSKDVAELQAWLAAAGVQARRERAQRLGVSQATDLCETIQNRSTDWSQVRPEWGLAGNASFVVAPRERTLGCNLEGRTFLHDYHAQDDPDGSLLEGIMTAPMIVTHWINLQYYASTVDNLRYGSGNKVLHNVVGGNLGVFEGNGGDLRIGLALQSLHDGTRWMHTPLRLSVFLEAPQSAIEAVLAKHAKVRALVDNEWLFLFQLDKETGCIHAYRAGAWVLEPGSGV